MSGLTNWVRSRSREQWLELWREKVTDIRIWIQEHPEKGFVVALVSGAVLMLLFRLVLWVVLLAALIGWLIWFFAEPEARRPMTGTSGDDVASKNSGPEDLP